jgi:sigma-E factor negative regulatory protein RseB
MTGPTLSRFVAIVLIVVVQGPARADDGDGRQWLERMSMAAQSLNYTGTFVYQNAGKLEAMHIVHVRDKDGERERLMSLTGPKREVLRDNQVVTCILGDRQSVHVNKSRPRAPFPFSLPKELIQLQKLYSFKVGGEDRVAGRSCRVVVVQPRDKLRYVLRSELTSPEGRVIEQVMFTAVDFPKHIDESELLPDLNGANYTWQREPDKQPEPGDVAHDSRWKVFHVPDGFMLTDHSWHQLSAHEPGVEHWVYSDGLAIVSVYIEASGGKDGYSGVSHRGALNVYGTMVDGYYVTVVGEVPRRTVEMIGKSVRIK